MQVDDYTETLFGSCQEENHPGQMGIAWQFDPVEHKYHFFLRDNGANILLESFPHLLEGHPYLSVILSSNLMVSVFTGNEDDMLLWFTLLLQLDSKRWIDTIWYLVFGIFEHIGDDGAGLHTPFLLLAAAKQRQGILEGTHTMPWACAMGVLSVLSWCARSFASRSDALRLHWDNIERFIKDCKVAHHPNYSRIVGGCGERSGTVEIPLSFDPAVCPQIPTDWKEAQLCSAVEDQEESVGVLTCLVNPCIVNSMHEEFCKTITAATKPQTPFRDATSFIEHFTHQYVKIQWSLSPESVADIPATPEQDVAFVMFVGTMTEDAAMHGNCCVTVPNYTTETSLVVVQQKCQQLQEVWSKATREETLWLPDIGFQSFDHTYTQEKQKTVIKQNVPGKQSVSLKRLHVSQGDEQDEVE